MLDIYESTRFLRFNATNFYICEIRMLQIIRMLHCWRSQDWRLFKLYFTGFKIAREMVIENFKIACLNAKWYNSICFDSENWTWRNCLKVIIYLHSHGSTLPCVRMIIKNYLTKLFNFFLYNRLINASHKQTIFKWSLFDNIKCTGQRQKINK